jgi:SagB-type dehydrogenase family enzyme
MPEIIKLPSPQKNLSFPLMQALAERRTTRKWQDKPLSEQVLSNLLWAACGINRVKKESAKRTAPSACNSKEIKIYIALPDGLFLYNEYEHVLIKTLAADIRHNIGTQSMMHSAPVGLIYVSDYSAMTSILFTNDSKRWFMSGVDTGFISQNVYLYCAAANLSTAVLGLINRNKLHSLMKLKESEHVVLTQVVGYAISGRL